MLRFSALLLTLAWAALAVEPVRWTPEMANEWYSKLPWTVGVNYIPASASNQLEMWQNNTFDPAVIDTELGWAQSLGMNSVRVFLHDLPWQQDSAGLIKRMNQFLAIANKHKIRVIFVLFSSTYDPFPEPGIQREIKAGVQNSAWVQSPGANNLATERRWHDLLEYVEGVIHEFVTDKRVLAWDLWNEPDNMNAGTTYNRSEPANKAEIVARFLPEVFKYARAALPQQPLTTGLWTGDWSSPDKLTPLQKLQIEESDIITFHNYGKPEDFEKRIQWLQQYHRPILCTEFMSRDTGSTFEAILPIAKKYNVAAFSWGFVAGKTQTYLPRSTWQTPFTNGKPAVWNQDIFTDTGAPFSQKEIDFIRQITGRGAAMPSGKSRK